MIGLEAGQKMVTLRTRMQSSHCDMFATIGACVCPRLWLAHWRTDDVFEIGAAKNKFDRDVRVSTYGVEGLWKAGDGDSQN